MAGAMAEQDIDVTLKVIVVGNGCVGKTSMITRYAKGVMTDNYKKTIGTDFFEKDCVVKGSSETVKLLLWDTAGQEMFAKLTKAYYKGAGAVVYVFSTTDRESFQEVENWRKKVEDEVGSICSVLVQNKTDLLHEAKMTSSEVDDLARRMGMRLYRTCVKDNLLVADVFEYLADCYLKRGGAAVSGDAAVMAITSGSAEHKKEAELNAKDAKTGAAAAAGASATPNSGAAANGTASSSATVDGMPATVSTGPDSASSGAAFRLEPSTQRTGGKKSGCGCS